MKRFAAVTLVLVLLAGGLFFALRPGELPSPARQSSAPAPAPERDAAAPRTAASAKVSPPPLEILDMAKELNDPAKTARDDLRVLEGVFLAYQSNFLKEGNPVGDNAEITAALTGKNKLHLAFLHPKHPAINAHGELCDRWGTPYFFHQLSGTQMEIVTAGPDRKRGTADDEVLHP